MKETDFTKATKEERTKYIVRPYEEIPITELVKDSNSHLVSAKNVTLSFLTMKANSAFEMHSHPQEQCMIVLEGYCDLLIEEKMYRVEKGDVIRMPSNIRHGAFIRDVDCVAIDIFSPRREDYLEKYRTQNPNATLGFDD